MPPIGIGAVIDQHRPVCQRLGQMRAVQRGISRPFNRGNSARRLVHRAPRTLAGEFTLSVHGDLDETACNVAGHVDR